MSNLEQLINELCPDGVKYKELGKIVKISNGKDHKHLADGEIPVYGSGGVMRYANQCIYDKVSVLIPRKGSIGNIFYIDTPFWTVDTIFYTKINLNLINARFLYHYLLTQNIEKLNTAGGVPSLTKTVLDRIQIPLPPIPVQEEIVRILDKFTKLTAELTAELTARKQQYEYYRDELFAFSDNVLYKPLQEIADIGTGGSNTNEELEIGKYPFFVRSQEVRRKDSYEFDETAIITSGDGVGVGKIFHYVEGKYALHQRAYRIHINTDDVIPKYYYYYMKSAFLSYIEKNSFHSSVTSIRRPMLNNLPVPIPYPEDKEKSLAEQQRIVDILDRFDKLCNNISEGLPAEIEARQKQYEYYRDKLLTFKKKEAAENEQL